jgi:N-dimethylarginine dimethylaminohydrolase
MIRELLLCPPDHYGIEYEINPWMSRARGAEAALAQKQWRDMHATESKLHCKIE